MFSDIRFEKTERHQTKKKTKTKTKKNHNKTKWRNSKYFLF